MPTTLETLPIEIICSIISFTHPFRSTSCRPHVLLSLNGTSRHLRHIVEEFARSLLKQYAPHAPLPSTARDKKQYLIAWLRCVDMLCQWCGKRSSRRAFFDWHTRCCHKCDKEEFSKITMTAAIKDHGLSKLDLFTPNALHPSLPSLRAVSTSILGGEVILVSTPDVLARQEHIRSLLSPSIVGESKFLRSRVARHDRILQHMGLVIQGTHGRLRWTQVTFRSVEEYRKARAEGIISTMRRSMLTKEAREQYVANALEREWAFMGMAADGKALQERGDAA